ncbi:MAG: rhomboid family intramembrane serine protease [Polyangiales bacterium]
MFRDAMMWCGLLALLAAVAFVAATYLHDLAWRALARDSLHLARAAAIAQHVLWPFRPREIPMLRLAVRAMSGDDLDVDRAVQSLPRLTPAARAVFAVSLEAWRGDIASAARRLDDPDTFAAAVAQGEVGLLLAVVGEARDADALCAAWARCAPPGVIPRAADTQVLMLLAAGVGLVHETDTLLEDLRAVTPPGRRAWWRCVARCRAGRADEARAWVDRALRDEPLSPVWRRRFEALRRAPLAPAVQTARVAQVVDTVRASVAAREALAELGWHRSAAPFPATKAAVVALVAAQAGVLRSARPSADALVRGGGLTVPLTSPGEAWRLLTYALLHADAMHLAVNLLTLVFFGRFIEHRLGGGVLGLSLALGASGGGALALRHATPGTVVVGASGAVFALVGASVAHIAREPALRRAPEGRQELLGLLTLLAGQCAFDAWSPRVSASAHVGGLIVGALVGAVTARRGRGRRRRAPGE